MKTKGIAIRAAKKAGAYLAREFHTLHHRDIRLKGTHDIVTRADIHANRIIIGELKKHFPNDDFLSEETGLEDNPETYRWIIDPLDGTTNYMVGNPLFCTSLALVHQREIVLAVMYAPMLKELYIAEKGKGATLNGKKVRVSQEARLRQSIITVGYSHDHTSRQKAHLREHRLWAHVLNTRLFASNCLDLAFVAAGRVEGCFLAPQIMPWDTAAGVLLIREAGGKVTDEDNKPWNIRSKSLVASNAKIHGKLIKIAE